MNELEQTGDVSFGGGEEKDENIQCPPCEPGCEGDHGSDWKWEPEWEGYYKAPNVAALTKKTNKSFLYRHQRSSFELTPAS